MDVAAACAAFVSVSEFESFSQGAAAIGLPQSVASRRVAALEAHLGGALLERTTKRVTLTELGRELLPTAAAVAAGPEKLLTTAHEILARPVILAVPELCDPLALARLTLGCREAGEPLSTTTADPRTRAQLIASGRASYSIEPAAPGEATWTVPLGVISRSPAPGGIRYLDTLRPSRARRGSRPTTLWVHSEDDVPHVRDRLTALRNSLGIGPTQVRDAANLTEALSEILASDDLLLGSRQQADELGLAWAEIGELHLVRGYRLGSGPSGSPVRFLAACHDLVADSLGARPATAPRAGIA